MLQQSGLDCSTVDSEDEMVPQHDLELLSEFAVLGKAFQCCGEVTRRRSEVVDDGRRLRAVVVPENRKKLDQRFILRLGGLDQISKQRVRIWSGATEKSGLILGIYRILPKFGHDEPEVELPKSSR